MIAARANAVLLLAVAVAVTACSSGDGPAKTTSDATVDASRLTLRQQIGQHFVFPFSGTRPPRALVRRIGRGEAAGVILFARNVRSVAQVRSLTRRLQAIARPAGLRAPLLVMVDQEGGDVRRLPGPPVKRAAEMGDDAGVQGAATARLLRRAGVNVDLAPVVDVPRRGSAMQAQGRVFGPDAETVTARAASFAKALADGGVAATLKHFPGFGAAKASTDDRAVKIALSLADTRAHDLLPYERIAAPLVMTSTAIHHAVDPAPASFSRRWVTTELRQRLGFDGVVITDDLQTPAVRGFGTPAELAYFAIFAGADLPLFARTYRGAADAADGLLRLVQDGTLTRARLAEGTARVLELRNRLAHRAF